ncbi:hypothetical protein, partial [Variovorax sp. E3]|uniref:hypothetical protein n=1 Tax=Variovorax sp. E3 TaxID=1914993 RepID=UPI0018DC4140
EARVAGVALSQAPAGDPPAAPVVPGSYATLTNGNERPRRTSSTRGRASRPPTAGGRARRA